jgi:hypothetical protein
MAFNIPVSVSLDAASGVDSPFSDDTYVVFSGSSVESWQPVSNTPSQSTSASSAASEYGSASTAAPTGTNASGTPANQTSATVASPAKGLTSTDYLLLAAAAAAAFFILRK